MHTVSRLILERRIRPKVPGQLKILWQYPRCDSEVSFGCQEKLQTRGILDILTGGNSEDSSLVS
jgi:hypothetical protein